MIQNGTKMVEVGCPEGVSVECLNPKCFRKNKKIGVYEKYFLDTLWDRTYCHQCGLCLRFSRKRAISRGEAIESVGLDT